MASQAETLLAVQLEQAGIPFESEFRFAPTWMVDEKGRRRRWRADFVIGNPMAYGRSILVEVDGGAYVAGRHTRGAGFEADAEKASAAAILGYRVIRCTPGQVEDGRALSWIRQALGIEVAA